MLKLRIEGKETDIQKYLEYIQVDKGIEVNSISALYPNRKNVYSRCYLEIKLTNRDGGEADD
ncbi:MAG: hypothetical protein IKE50_01005 [Erysipelotrichaceae bacterium]|nr:hypothetical protein [Erysipelotrichaceae bacterium]